MATIIPPSAAIDLRMGKQGRIVIPAGFRRELALEEGDRLVLRVIDGEIRIMSVREGIRKAQQLVRQHVHPGVSMVDELIAERRAEAARENQA